MMYLSRLYNVCVIQYVQNLERKTGRGREEEAWRNQRAAGNDSPHNWNNGQTSVCDGSMSFSNGFHGHFLSLSSSLCSSVYSLYLVQRAGVTFKVDNRLPNLVNLNEDPQLSEMLLYMIKEGETKVGKLKSESAHDIQLSGALISDEHWWDGPQSTTIPSFTSFWIDLIILKWTYLYI